MTATVVPQAPEVPQAPQLIEIAFKGNRKDFFLWEADSPPPLGAAVIVDADRGEDLGYVHAVGERAALRNAGTPHGYGTATPTQVARRIATADELAKARELTAANDDARRRTMERVRANQLVMKLTDAEWQWDRKKLTLYFTADKRVDFRTLVRELAAMFRARIELKQIGIRDEAKRLDGIGRCGRQYCSSAWLPELRPVNLGVAKDQRLSLNPSQISGACGRLMCCLRYEHDFYVTARRRFPKEGKIVRTSRGEEKILANDIFRERVTLKAEDGEVRILPLADFRLELEAAGAPFTTPPIGTLVVEEPCEGEAVDAGVIGFAAERPELYPSALEELALDETSVELGPEAPAPEDTLSVDVSPTPADDPARARRPNRRRGRRGGRRSRPAAPGDSQSESDDPSPPSA